MTKEEIIQLAREARLAEPTHPFNPWGANDEALERFANLVAAAEREECAIAGGAAAMAGLSHVEVAEAIRARGNND